MIDHTVGAVLVGGESRRMGTPKADLEYLGVSFVDHAAATLSMVTSDVIVVGSEYTGPLPAIPDATEGTGPLAGILAALEYAFPLPVAVLAVDLPLVSIELVTRLVEPKIADGSLRIATDGFQRQPLCGTWGPDLVKPLATYLADGGRSVLDFVDTAGDVELVSADSHILTNINTPADYAMLHGGGEP